MAPLFGAYPSGLRDAPLPLPFLPPLFLAWPLPLPLFRPDRPPRNSKAVILRDTQGTLPWASEGCPRG
eukprot:16428674-Heterocapsa_arctica.AAC.1